VYYVLHPEQLQPGPAPVALSSERTRCQSQTIASKIQPWQPEPLTLFKRNLLLSPPPNPNSTIELTDFRLINEPISTETRYSTVWGCLTFAELHQQTYRYAIHLLREHPRYSIDTVDDGLQASYLNLWQRLQNEPTLLAGRNIAWIGKFIYYGAVQQRQVEISDGSYRYDTPMPRSGAARPHSHETRQADKRIDLQAAIVATANHILAQPTGIHQDRAIWALYGITMLQIQVTEMSHLFRVHHRAMKKAYEDVHLLLKQHLDGYVPRHETCPIRKPAQESLPYQDICAIRKQNGNIEPSCYEKVQQELEQLNPDTLDRDLIALQGIREHVTAKEQARIHGKSYSSMQRAYERIHLLLAAQSDETVIPRRPQKIHAKPFEFRPEYAPMLQLLANELLRQPNSDGKIIALYSYLCNIPNRTSARNFQMSESTLRHYRQNIQERLNALIDTATVRATSEIIEVRRLSEVSKTPLSESMQDGRKFSPSECIVSRSDVAVNVNTVIYEANKGYRIHIRKQEIHLRTRRSAL
jgi:hypothetical protein